MATQTRRTNPLQRAIDELEATDLSVLPQAQRDVAFELRTLLQQIQRVQVGEVRIVASGATASMKSTTLELLLGRPQLVPVGLGAVTATPTEIRLRQGPAALTASWVVTMTQDAALRRARGLLGLDDSDPRPLTGLVNADHPNRHVVAELLAATREFDFGTRYDIAEFRKRGGGVAIGNFAAAFVQRVIFEASIPQTAWDLSWAGDRTVVVIDLPGTGEGRALENLIRDEQQSLAHIVLNVVAVTGGSGMTPPPTRPEPHCVYVATKVDRVENPRNANELLTVESAVGAAVERWRSRGQEARIAAVSGVWAFPDETSWQRFDPSNPDAWPAGRRALTEWQQAAWDPHGPTGGDLREAIEAAMRDGGIGRLQQIIAELAGKVRPRIDELELARLVDQARQVLSGARHAGLDPRAEQLMLSRLREELDNDQQPIDELRRLAGESAARAVCDLPAWDTVRHQYTFGGVWQGSMTEVRQAVETVDLATAAETAALDAAEQLTTHLHDWAERYRRDAGLPPGAPMKWEELVEAGSGERYAALAQPLLAMLVDVPGPTGPGRRGGAAHGPLMLRRMARTRSELAMLLEHLLVTMLLPIADESRRAVRAAVDRRLTSRAPADRVAPLLTTIERELRRLADDGRS